jgi:16S rRNA processing protein RimM
LGIARVLRPWGVRGEVRIEVLTSHPEHLAPGQRVFLGEAHRPFEVRSARAQGESMIIGLQGCDSPEQAEALRGLMIYLARSAAAPLGPNEYYHHQIIGLTVLADDGEELGRLQDILETGAHDVYVVRGSRGEVLLPARVEVVKRVDLAAGIMQVSVPPGLLPE